ncbi:MAG: hypothetical protein KDB69_00435 [Acidimicrobiia bacterium]|nr:hypothetical protein [Acidimicrobiia bacterium]
MAFPDGWARDTNDELGLVNPSAAAILYPTEDLPRIIAFYDEWTADQSAEFSKTESSEFTVYQNLETGASISIQIHEDGDTTYVLVGVVAP